MQEQKDGQRAKVFCAICGREILPGDSQVERYDGKPLHEDCAEEVFIECEDCGKYFPRTAMTNIDGDDYCNSCRNENFVECYECGDWIKKEDATKIDGRYYCDNCVDEYFVRCPDCGDLIHKDDAIEVGDGYFVCESCHDNYEKCEYCERYFRRNEMYRTDSGNYVCESCFDCNYVQCHECGCAIHEDNANCHENNYYCDDCCPNNDCCSGVIDYHGYNSRDYSTRNCAGDSEKLYFGVELESEDGNFDIDDFNDYLDDDCSPLIHFEEDGSLNSSGVEAITQPCSLEYHQKVFDWKRFCGILIREGFESHNTNNCGLHVHITRNALKPTTIVKMDVFINRARDFFSVIARRTDIYCCDGNYDIRKMANKNKAYVCERHRDRYTAVNTTNYKTVEIRIFRGTLRYDTIVGTIEILHGLIRFLDNLPIVKIYDTEKNVIKFIDFLAENHEKYPHVLPMMRRLFVSPRCTREDYISRIGQWYGKFVKRTADENEI